MEGTVLSSIVLVVLAAFVQTGGAEQTCYSCSYTRTSNPKVNYDCITEPWNFTIGSPTLRCNSSCTINRVVSLADNTIKSFSRGCLIDQAKYGNRCVEDTHENTCFSSCFSDFCNHGDGTHDWPRSKAWTLQQNTLLTCAIGPVIWLMGKMGF